MLFSDLNIINAFKLWRIIFLILAAISGILGIAIGLFIFILKMVSVSSAGLPYTYPFAPVNFTRLTSDIMTRKSISDLKDRDKILTSNVTKYKTNS